MNNEFKKGFLEAIDGVLDIINDAGQELDKDNKSFKYEIKKLENAVLGLKLALFETYYENNEKDDETEKIELPKEAKWTGDDIDECLNHVKKQPDATLENSIEMARLR